jgi:hypothetical protein
MKALIGCAAILGLSAVTAMAGEGRLSNKSLTKIGLGGMKLMSDSNGLEIRGLGISDVTTGDKGYKDDKGKKDHHHPKGEGDKCHDKQCQEKCGHEHQSCEHSGCHLETLCCHVQSSCRAR